ncbi:hypothetical protein M8C21_008005, partial [Ambrosia artemisiifolia]
SSSQDISRLSIPKPTNLLFPFLLVDMGIFSDRLIISGVLMVETLTSGGFDYPDDITETTTHLARNLQHARFTNHEKLFLSAFYPIEQLRIFISPSINSTNDGAMYPKIAKYYIFWSTITKMAPKIGYDIAGVETNSNMSYGIASVDYLERLLLLESHTYSLLGEQPSCAPGLCPLTHEETASKGRDGTSCKGHIQCYKSWSVEAEWGAKGCFRTWICCKMQLQQWIGEGPDACKL